MSASFLDNTLCTEANHLKGRQKGNTFIHFHLILTAHVKFYSFGFFTGPFLSGRLLWVSPDLAGTPVGLPLKITPTVLHKFGTRFLQAKSNARL